MTLANEAAFTVQMSGQQKTKAIKDAEQTVRRILGQIGPSDAVTRFLSRYGKIRTKKVYCIHSRAISAGSKRRG